MSISADAEQSGQMSSVTRCDSTPGKWAAWKV